MKKIALMLSILMSVSVFAGCGNDNEASSDKNSSSASQSTSKTEFERGTIENNVYTSDFANLKFTAPEGWEFANDEYIANTMGISLDVIEKDDDLTKALLEQTSIYDAMCIEQSTGKNIIIMYENIAKEVPNPDSFTADDYLDSVEQQFDTVANVTITNNSDRENVTINGEDYIKKDIHMSYDEMGVEVNQVYYVRKIGNYMLGIIASSGNTADDMSVYEKNFIN